VKRWLLAAACGVAALGLMLYPLVGEFLSERYHSDVETTYTAAIADTDDTELTAQRQAAEQYNAMLSGTASISEGEASASPLPYAEQLTVGGVMCYIDIPKINVYLPVQHGTDADTLERAVGHVVGTSLPVGGSSTHAVLSAHSGMASSRLFSDIEQLAEGDTFYIHVLGEVLAYQVDAINTVLPMDTRLLQIEDGKDLVTLVTCTPFGVNTHRPAGAVCAGAESDRRRRKACRILVDTALPYRPDYRPWRGGRCRRRLLFSEEVSPCVRHPLCWRRCWRWRASV
jgi:sortase A